MFQIRKQATLIRVEDGRDSVVLMVEVENGYTEIKQATWGGVTKPNGHSLTANHPWWQVSGQIWDYLTDNELVALGATGPDDYEFFATDKLKEYM